MWSKWSSKIKSKVILEVSLDLKIYSVCTVYSYRMIKIVHLNSCCKSKTLYSGHLVIADIFLRTSGVRYREVWLSQILINVRLSTFQHFYVYQDICELLEKVLWDPQNICYVCIIIAYVFGRVNDWTFLKYSRDVIIKCNRSRRILCNDTMIIYF